MKLHKALPFAAAVFGLLGSVTAANAGWTLVNPSTGAIAIASDGKVGDSTATLNSVAGAFAANGGGTAGNVTYAGAGCAAGVISSSCGNYGINGFSSAATTWATTTSNSAAALQGYTGGLGMASDSTGSNQPNHAIDNGPKTGATDLVSGLGNTEAVLLNFSSSVVLTSIGIGWKGYTGNNGDADISLFRWTGVNGPTASLNGVKSSLTDMQTAGWELVGNYGDLSVDTTNAYNLVNGGGKGSSWWLISAYNSSYGSATSGSVNQGDDYFKLFAVAGTACSGSDSNCGRGTNPPGVPEPASLALVAIAGLGALTGSRRRQRVLAAG